MLVLQYIGNKDRRFNTFVANRISTIHRNNTPQQWRHVTGELNPADDASRGLSADGIVNSQRLHGPDFLSLDSTQWPIRPDTDKKRDGIPPEETKKDLQIYTTITHKSDDVMNCLLERYSSWYKLQKIVAWILRYKKILLAKIRRVCLNPCPQDLTVEEIKEAAVQIIIYIQTQMLDKRHLVNLRPVQASNNVLCIGGRIASAPISKEARNPIILPARHFVIAGHSG